MLGRLSSLTPELIDQHRANNFYALVIHGKKSTIYADGLAKVERILLCFVFVRVMTARVRTTNEISRSCIAISSFSF